MAGTTSETMANRAAVYRGDGTFDVREVAPRRPGPGESMIRVEAAGLCGTDLHITSVPTSYRYDTDILGHEIAGRVIEGPEDLIGKRVVVDPTVVCGVCSACRRGLYTQCADFSSIGVNLEGGFQEHLVVPTDHLYTISEEIDAATATIAEPLSCIVYALSRVPRFSPAGRAVVLGGGPIGVLFAAILERALAQEVVVVEPSEARAAHIASRLGARVVHPGGIPEGFEPEVVVDATGFLFAEAVRIARPGGTIVCFGLEDRGGASSQTDFTQKELMAVSARAANGTFGEAVRLLEACVVVAEDLISGTYPLERIEEAFAEARAGKCLKVVLTSQASES